MMSNDKNAPFYYLAKQLGDINAQLDDDGFPILPEDVNEKLNGFVGSKYSNLNKRERDKADQLARRVHTVWGQANYENINISEIARRSNEAVCTTLKPRDIQVFTDSADVGAIVYKDEYPSDDERRYVELHLTLGVIKAKQICAQCPLQMACLAASVTRSEYKNDELIFLTPETGVYGGFGYAARDIIQDAFIKYNGEFVANEQAEAEAEKQALMLEVMAATEVSLNSEVTVNG